MINTKELAGYANVIVEIEQLYNQAISAMGILKVVFVYPAKEIIQNMAIAERVSGLISMVHGQV